MKFCLSGKCKIKPRREEHSLYSIKWHYLACRHYGKQRGLIVPETERQNHRQICTLHLWDGTKFILMQLKFSWKQSRVAGCLDKSLLEGEGCCVVPENY